MQFHGRVATIIVEMNIKWIIGIIIFLWLIGFVQFPFLTTQLFHVFGRAFTLHHLLLLLVLGYAVRFLPGMLQTAVVILIVIWLASIFIFPAIGGFVYILFIIFILWLLFSFI